MSESHRRNLFLALCALVLLHTGVHLSQSFVNYPGWYVLEAESFKAYPALDSVGRHCPRHWRHLVDGAHLTSDPCPARHSR